MERLTEYVTENCSKPFYRFRSDGEICVHCNKCERFNKKRVLKGERECLTKNF